jgi:hypothetical protein
VELSDEYKQRLRRAPAIDRLMRLMPEEFALAQQIWREFADMPEEERLKCALVGALDSYFTKLNSPEQRVAKALERIADRLDEWDSGNQGRHVLDVRVIPQ